MTSILTSSADAAHSAAVALATTSQIKAGDALPAVPVKEDAVDASINIHDIPGKIIIVRIMRPLPSL
jgi:hypothetical protein